MQQKWIDIFHVTIDPPCVPPTLPLIRQPLRPCVSQCSTAGERGCCWCFPAAAKSSGMNREFLSYAKQASLVCWFLYQHNFLWGSLLCLLIGKNNNNKMSINMTADHIFTVLSICKVSLQLLVRSQEGIISVMNAVAQMCFLGFTRTLFKFLILHETVVSRRRLIYLSTSLFRDLKSYAF